jgi:hypothetical protein
MSNKLYPVYLQFWVFDVLSLFSELSLFVKNAIYNMRFINDTI